MTNLNQIISNVTNEFELERIGNSYPEKLSFGLGLADFKNVPTDFRVNHYLLKNQISSEIFDQGLPTDIVNYIESVTYMIPFALRLEFYKRYMYLTFDQGFVEPLKTLRDGGWHIDGLQGNEVPVKQNGDFCLMVSDCLPTEFYTGQIDLSDCDLSKDNIFKRIDERISLENYGSMFTQNNETYLFDYCAIHRGTPATEKTYRKLCRIHFTDIPITSVKLTVNPFIEYEYEIHTTGGNIPAHLM